MSVEEEIESVTDEEETGMTAGTGRGIAVAAARPPWSRVHANRWTELNVPELGAWQPSRSVTVVIPHYEAQGPLALTLVALDEQSYPTDLFEVVIVDDGSRRPPEIPDGLSLNVKVIQQERKGFGLARARNAGAASAQGEILIFLDCDMLPEPRWLEAHARWHHSVADAATLGFRLHVDVGGVSIADVRRASRSGALEPLFAGREIERPEWIEYHMDRTEGLTSPDDDLFRVVTGGNLAMRAETFERCRGFDATFNQWGAEDTEFGFRLFTDGTLLVPERRALCWHQGLGHTPDPSEQASLEEQRARISQLIAEKSFRRRVPGRSYKVPSLLVEISTEDESSERIVKLVESVLANRFHDLVVMLRLDESHPQQTLIRRLFHGDARVVCSADGGDTAEEFLHVPLRCRMSVAAVESLGEQSIERLVRHLERTGAGVLEVTATDGSTITTLYRTRALRRARRVSSDPALTERLAGVLFGSGRVDARAVDLKARGHDLIRGRFSWVGLFSRLGHLKTRGATNANVAKVRARARLVRTPSDLWAFALWLFGGLRWRLRGRLRAIDFGTARTAPSDSEVQVALQPPRLGSRRERFSTGLRVGFFEGRGADVLGSGVWPVPVYAGDSDGIEQANIVVVPTDEPPAASITESAERHRKQVFMLEEPPGGVGAWTVRSSSQSDDEFRALVPVDVSRFNPIGCSSASAARDAVVTWRDSGSEKMRDWLRTSPSSGRCDPVAVDEGDGATVRAGQERLELSSEALIRELRPYRAVWVPEALHERSDARARIVVDLACSGIPLMVDQCGGIFSDLIGERLAAALSRIEPGDLHDVVLRERASVRLRRAALRDHAPTWWWRRVAEIAGVPTRRAPSVSVTLASNRPEMWPHLAQQLRGLDYPEIEFVMMAHGDGLDAKEIAAQFDGLPIHIQTVPEELTLGDALNSALEIAAGEVVTKVDDDDWYGPDHIWDLVLALDYSGADLVGKAAEFVYLRSRDTTVRRFSGGGESHSLTLAGGTLALRRDDLFRLGGWRRVRRRVDQGLIRDVGAAGGRCYRTHGFGYVLNRHGAGHTWDEHDDHFLAQAEEVAAGCALDWADAERPADTDRNEKH